MSDWLWSIVWGLLPWWVWLGLGVAAAFAVYRLLGWKGALAVLAVTFGSVAYSRGAKRGLEVERAKQDAADEKARDVIAEKKEDVRTITPEERKDRFSKWEKP